MKVEVKAKEKAHYINAPNSLFHSNFPPLKERTNIQPYSSVKNNPFTSVKNLSITVTIYFISVIFELFYYVYA